MEDFFYVLITSGGNVYMPKKMDGFRLNFLEMSVMGPWTIDYILWLIWREAYTPPTSSPNLLSSSMSESSRAAPLV